MTKTDNLKFLKSYSSIAKPEVQPKLDKLFQLFAERRMRNFETAKSIADKLVSSHKATVKSGISMFDKALVKYENSEPVGKPIELTILGDLQIN